MSNKQKLSCEEKAIRAPNARQHRREAVSQRRSHLLTPPFLRERLVANARVSGVTDTQRLGEW